MQSTFSSDVRGAFELLRDVVNDLEARGRITASAGIKPEMQRRSLRGFDEHRLGFRSFGDFLRAAQRAGVVARVPMPDGRQVFRATGQSQLAQPIRARRDPSRTQLTLEPIGPRRSPRRLRREIWEAFMDWREDVKRVYDRESGRIHMFNADPRPGEPSEDAEIRAAALANGDRFVFIEPIGMEAQSQWMADFVDSHSTHPLAVPLRNTLVHAERPFQAFSRIVRTDPDFAREWNTTRLNRVAAVVTAWMAEHGLEFDPWEGGDERQRTEVAGVAGQRPDATELDRLRTALHTAIDRMPEGELLKLSIPLEYLTGTGL